jgi:hypothetical protein
MLGGAAAARQVFEAAIKQLGPLPQLVQQWTTLEQQAQLIPAARAVLGFRSDTAAPLQQQQQQQQQDSKRVRRSRSSHVQQQEQQATGGSSSSQPAAAEQVQAQLQQLLTTLQAQVPGQAAVGAGREVQQGQQPQAQQQQQQQQQETQSQRRRQRRRQQAEADSQEHTSKQLASSSPQQQQQQLQHQEGLELEMSTPVQTQQAGAQVGLQQQQHVGSSNAGDCSSSTTGTQPPAAAAEAPGQGSKRSIGPVPSHVPSLVSAAVMEHRAGNIARAQQLYEAARQLEPTNPKLLHSMAQMWLKEGDRAAAEQYLAALQVSLLPTGGGLGPVWLAAQAAYTGQA